MLQNFNLISVTVIHISQFVYFSPIRDYSSWNFFFLDFRRRLKHDIHSYWWIYMLNICKAIIHFRYRKKKVHRFTNNLQGLQKVMVKDFSWNIIPWNALLFEKTLKQYQILDIENYGFILNTCHDTAKCAETRVGFPVIFSRLWWPIEPKCLQVCYYISCDTRSVGRGQYCLPKVSNGLNRVKTVNRFKKPKIFALNQKVCTPWPQVLAIEYFTV